MGSALAMGLVANQWAKPSELHVAEPDSSNRKKLQKAIPEVSVGDEPLTNLDTVIAVKPDVVRSVLKTLSKTGVRRVLSIAAGVRISAIESGLPSDTPVIRAMPNTPALVGKGASAITAGNAATASDLKWAQTILHSVGTVEIVNETDLDAVTGLSGSGPAYLFQLAEAMITAGVAQGLCREVADSLTRQTLIGACTLLVSSDADPAQLRKNVTSPGGTTEAGLAVLNDANFTYLIGKVVSAATQRARELGIESEDSRMKVQS